VSSRSAVSVPELKAWGPSAVVFSVGAQGTKKLGLPGEDAKGVYAAKDFVYHYNLLPPFPSMDFSTGKRVAIIGMGNVMVDIARWLLLDAPVKTAEEVIVVARRGPFEAKFDQKEFVYIEPFLDRAAFDEELRRIQPQLTAVGQDIGKLSDETFPVLNKPAQPAGERRLHFRFLSSPQQIHPDSNGRIERLTLVENVLFEREGTIGCKATEKATDLNVDTMIFAIGDVADPALGLPYNRDSYITNPDPVDPKRAAYELFDAQGGRVLDGMYAVGWARKASDGLVGIARHDGEVGAAHVLKYLETARESDSACAEQVRRFLEQKGLRVIDKADLELLARAEEKMARDRNVAWFKFDNDEAMLAAIEAERAKAAPA
jgi:ferredoxin--NADP+ reductase